MSLYLGENLISGSKPINLGVRNIGEVFLSPLPITDAGAHLLDGGLILGGGIHQGFIDYIANLYTENTSANYFCTEAQWQASVSQYGVCGKFVYTEGVQSYYAWNTALGDIYYTLTEEKAAPYYYKEDGVFVETTSLPSLTTRASQYDEIGTPSTVRLPKVTGIIEGTTDIATLGNLVEAGLPNIAGSISTLIPWTSASGTGALYSTSKSYNFVNGQNSQTVVDGIYIDASRSNPTYGNSTTVQPQTIKYFVYIVIATSTKTDTQTDIDDVVTDLNGKADVDLSNMNASLSAKNEIISWGLPDWDNKISLSTNNVVNAIPSLGYVHLNTRTATPAGLWNMKINDNIVATWYNSNTYAYGGFAFIPVKQGDTTVITAANLGDGATYEFVPMKGAN